MKINEYSQITPEIMNLSDLCLKNSNIDPELYIKYDVKRGLRDVSGKGVLTGLTEISEVQPDSTDESGNPIHGHGRLFYRGIDVEDIVNGSMEDNFFCYEETAYLLLFGQLPTKEQLNQFIKILAFYRTLPPNFVRDVVLKAPSANMMNTLARSVLTLYSYDTNSEDVSIPNVLRQSLQLIALFPCLAVYAYQAYSHYIEGKSLIIHRPRPELSTAENILRILRPDKQYTPLEARILDAALVLHAEHGGGNNSTFTTHVVTSTGTDTYSSVAASLGSLKGPKHGGANIKVVEMFGYIKKAVSDWTDEDEIRNYLNEILDKKAFDKTGLIYGMGHAVYSLSDPRARVLKKLVKNLSEEKGLAEEYELYANVERIAAELISEKRRIYKGVGANVDFYSGFVYSMLGLPMQLYTPMFAVSRIAGWSAHRIEELINGGRIIRPAYMQVCERTPYKPIEER